MRKRLGVVFWTGPNAIKMAPVVFELHKHAREFEPVVISTGQTPTDVGAGYIRVLIMYVY
jgi:UDP-N-acetylglucosamine 2-epimerase